jgi:hypothetical protein
MTETSPTYDTGKSSPATKRANRYVYHVHGHAKLHAIGTTGDSLAAPFEVVLRRPFAITDDAEMDEVRQEVRQHILQELAKQDSPYQVGDVMIRGVSKLHRILVDAHDPDGPAARVMS